MNQLIPMNRTAIPVEAIVALWPPSPHNHPRSAPIKFGDVE